MSTVAAIHELAGRLRAARRITVVTGAGVSAASGVPTFRGAGGLWRNFRAENLATPHAFARDPRLVWEWYDWRRQVIARCAPNPAHEVLAQWTRRPGVTLVTQNVDGLHERAGAERVVRLHGSIWELRCWDDCAASPRAWRDQAVPLQPLPPRCPHCGGLARPGVVWFGESLDSADVAAALAATRCDVFLAVGTSAVVYPAAGLLSDAAAQGAYTGEINPEATPSSAQVDVCVQAPAEVALVQLRDLLRDW